MKKELTSVQLALRLLHVLANRLRAFLNQIFAFADHVLVFARLVRELLARAFEVLNGLAVVVDISLNPTEPV